MGTTMYIIENSASADLAAFYGGKHAKVISSQDGRSHFTVKPFTVTHISGDDIMGDDCNGKPVYVDKRDCYQTEEAAWEEVRSTIDVLDRAHAAAFEIRDERITAVINELAIDAYDKAEADLRRSRSPIRSIISGLFSKSDSKIAKDQLETFLRHLEQCPPQNLGLTVAMVEHFANMQATFGQDFYDPSSVMESCPETLPWIIDEAHRLQSNGLAAVAAGWIIWVHTFKAVKFPELKPLAKQMWRHLSTGFPYAHDHADTLEPLIGFVLRVENPNRFPRGFAPDQQC